MLFGLFNPQVTISMHSVACVCVCACPKPLLRGRTCSKNHSFGVFLPCGVLIAGSGYNLACIIIQPYGSVWKFFIKDPTIWVVYLPRLMLRLSLSESGTIWQTVVTRGTRILTSISGKISFLPSKYLHLVMQSQKYPIK